MIRRSVAAAALAVALLLSGCASDGDDTTPGANSSVAMTWQLDINPLGRHAPFYVGLEKGFYRDAGLDVTIQPGQGSGAATTNVATGAVDAAFVSVGAAAIAKIESPDAPLVYVASIYSRAPYTVYSLASRANIRTPADLNGHCVSASETSTIWQQMDGWANKEGISGYEWCYRAEDVRGRLLIENDIDSILSYTISEPALQRLAEQAGETLVAMRLADYGFAPFVSNGVLVNTEFAQKNPEAVTAFIDATLKAYKYAFEHPEEAADIMAQRFPTLDPAITVAELKLVEEEVTDNGKKTDIGCFTRDAVQSTIELSIDDPSKVNIDSLFSFDYLPEGACNT